MPWGQESIFDSLLIVMAIIGLFLGTEKWCKYGFHLKALSFITAGVLIAALMVGGPIYMNQTIRNLTSLLNDDKGIEKKLLSRLEHKDCDFVMMAQKVISERAFMKNGVLRTYENCEGEEVVFTPTQEDIDTFKEWVITEACMDAMTRGTKRNTVAWIFIVVFSVLLGLARCFRKRHEKQVVEEKLT
ncbi:hypothetical protein [Sulfurimonas diazotrophicus]|uniref:Uncharacterized protein n=1 Tax=Sulfurimonas diazotrophicus TaxID=3131939 RepID=A0ABZ3H7I0_9BACT